MLFNEDNLDFLRIRFCTLRTRGFHRTMKECVITTSSQTWILRAILRWKQNYHYLIDMAYGDIEDVEEFGLRRLTTQLATSFVTFDSGVDTLSATGRCSRACSIIQPPRTVNRRHRNKCRRWCTQTFCNPLNYILLFLLSVLRYTSIFKLEVWGYTISVKRTVNDDARSTEEERDDITALSSGAGFSILKGKLKLKNKCARLI